MGELCAILAHKSKIPNLDSKLWMFLGSQSSVRADCATIEYARSAGALCRVLPSQVSGGTEHIGLYAHMWGPSTITARALGTRSHNHGYSNQETPREKNHREENHHTQDHGTQGRHQEASGKEEHRSQGDHPQARGPQDRDQEDHHTQARSEEVHREEDRDPQAGCEEDHDPQDHREEVDGTQDHRKEDNRS